MESRGLAEEVLHCRLDLPQKPMETHGKTWFSKGTKGPVAGYHGSFHQDSSGEWRIEADELQS